MEYNITYPIEPYPYKRPRYRRSGKPYYDDGHYTFKSFVDIYTRNKIGEKLKGAVKLEVTFYLKKPKATDRDYPHVRPDLTGFIRIFEDSLSGALFKDDGQVTDMDVKKRYINPGEEPRIVMSAWELDET